MIINLCIVYTDSQDGSYYIRICKNKEEGLEILNRTEEQLKQGDIYNDGALKEIKLEGEMIDGVFHLSKTVGVSIG